MPAADYLIEHSYGGYTTNLPHEDLTGGEACVAHQFDDAPLEPEHGGASIIELTSNPGSLTRSQRHASAVFVVTAFWADVGEPAAVLATLRRTPPLEEKRHAEQGNAERRRPHHGRYDVVRGRNRACDRTGRTWGDPDRREQREPGNTQQEARDEAQDPVAASAPQRQRSADHDSQQD